MHTYLFGADLNDFKRSLFRKGDDEAEIGQLDAVRFFNNEGEPIFLLAAGSVADEKGTNTLYSFTNLVGDIEYVMRLDEDTMIWEVLSGDFVKRPKVTLKHRSLYS